MGETFVEEKGGARKNISKPDRRKVKKETMNNRTLGGMCLAANMYENYWMEAKKRYGGGKKGLLVGWGGGIA